MKALGMIETIGMVGAIEALDTALKTADVDVLNRHIVKGGIVTVEIVGDVGAIKVAVEAGAKAAKNLGVFIGAHVIARPDDMVFEMIEKDSVIYQEKKTDEKKKNIVEKVEKKLEIEKEEKAMKLVTASDKEKESTKIEKSKEVIKQNEKAEKILKNKINDEDKVKKK